MRYEHRASDPHGFKRTEIAVWDRVYRGKTAVLTGLSSVAAQTLSRARNSK
jgi:hypothetical protein